MCIYIYIYIYIYIKHVPCTLFFTHTSNQTVSLCHYTYVTSGVRVVPNKNERQLLVLPSYMPSRGIIFSSGLQGLFLFFFFFFSSFFLSTRKEKREGSRYHDEIQRRKERKTEERTSRNTRVIHPVMPKTRFLQSSGLVKTSLLPVLSLFIFFFSTVTFFFFFLYLTNRFSGDREKKNRKKAEVVKS